MEPLEPLARWLLSRPPYVKALFFIAAFVLAITFGLVAGNVSYRRWAERKEA